MAARQVAVLYFFISLKMFAFCSRNMHTQTNVYFQTIETNSSFLIRNVVFLLSLHWWSMWPVNQLCSLHWLCVRTVWRRLNIKRKLKKKRPKKVEVNSDQSHKLKWRNKKKKEKNYKPSLLIKCYVNSLIPFI